MATSFASSMCKSSTHTILPLAFLFPALLLLVGLQSHVDSLSPDGHALLAFHRTMQNPDSKLQWSPSDDTPCAWYGVKCSPASPSSPELHVVELSLDVYLHGSLAPELGSLSELRVLNLSFTNISGTIPPQLANAAFLELVDLSANGLSGPIPSELGALSHMHTLLLMSNNLGGSIPSSLANCSALRVLWLHDNNLTGIIPPQFGWLASLETLRLGGNGQLTGPLPPELGNCKNLTQLGAAATSISDCGLVNKQALSVAPALGNCAALDNLQLDNNQLTGLGACTALRAIDFSYNQLTGPIPREIFGLQNLVKLILLSNNLTGSLPPEVGNCKSLIRLRLPSNALSGNLPKELGLLEGLVFLDIYDNQFEGPIPIEISKLTSMQLLDAHSNKLSGSIPPELGSLSNLQQLDLGSNQLMGLIPAEIGRLKSLNKLDLSNNELYSRIPGDLQDCLRLTFLDLSHNRLSGSIPSELGNISSLDIALDLSWNNLTGEIPDKLGRLTQLQSLDLSHNKITGSLYVLSSMESLTFLNVSYNLFTGSLPDTPFFRTLMPSQVMGNPGLCTDASATSPCPGGRLKANSPGSGATSLVICLLTSAAAAMFFLIALLLVYRLRRASQEVDLEEVDSPWPWSVTYFCKLNLSVDDVLDGLVDRNIIGRGCSGLVYKVEIPGGSFIAVKKLWPSKKDEHDAQQHDSFASEIETLGHIRHRNIVRLLGYCTNRTEKLLIYDYMPNGSLADLLFERRGPVDWELRYNIIVGAAHGLAYLHHDCNPPILHRDVKTNNILLDSRFHPFLADFGLAKLVEASERAKDNMSKVAGSYGYIAPEYGYTLKITEKSDVYSFGIVLLEVITGRRAVETSTSDGLHILEWVQMMKRSYQPTLEILDPRLRGMPDPFIQEMEQALGVALLCVNVSPLDRPTMKDVVALLLEVKHPLEEFTKISQPLMPKPPHHYHHAAPSAGLHHPII
ncbi:hypothetical protein GOP47_0025392 [Adiantum capillus-veneris]|uniref:Protein kinase domain-containing protein n=1 Tax=Adiantum capillus-veneris TaxID=13818 RepID=A0A9D4U183_ADICA|nr:hypothetical protein GOP47_0025392 [Adiantum capillus-veneris]